MTNEEKARAYIRRAIAKGRYVVGVAITGPMPDADAWQEVGRLLTEDEKEAHAVIATRWAK